MKRPFQLSVATGGAGVTLIELVMTIAIVGILAAIIVQFVSPVRSYIDSSRRAALADTADTALRRIARDLRLALPNSVRVDNTTRKYVEFMLVRTGGRYRYDTDSLATNTCSGGFAEDVLSFSAADTCFKTLGNIPNLSDVTTSDYVVVFNLPTGTDKADAYQLVASCGASCNKSQITAKTPLTGEDKIEFASNTFTYESPGNRFFIVEGPVTYSCDLSARTLTRYSGYPITATLTPVPPAGATSIALMASGVTDCNFTYDTSLAAQGAGLVTMALKLSTQDSRGDTESVYLYHAVHVNNVP